MFIFAAIGIIIPHKNGKDLIALEQTELAQCTFDYSGYRLKIKNSFTKDELIRKDFNECLKTNLGDGYFNAPEVKGSKCIELAHSINNSITRDIASNTEKYDKVYRNLVQCKEIQ